MKKRKEITSKKEKLTPKKEFKQSFEFYWIVPNCVLFNPSISSSTFFPPKVSNNNRKEKDSLVISLQLFCCWKTICFIDKGERERERRGVSDVKRAWMSFICETLFLFFSLLFIYKYIGQIYIYALSLYVCVCVVQNTSGALPSSIQLVVRGGGYQKRLSPHPSPYKLSLSPYIHIRWQIQSMHARLLYIQYIQTKYQICIYMHCVYVHGRTSQSGSSTPLRTHTHTHRAEQSILMQHKAHSNNKCKQITRTMRVCGGEKHQRARAIPTHFYFYYYFNVSRQQN